jgi:hypothetical protein
MQTPLYTELFPDQCEVVEMPLHTQWIYLIQKNGSSSLRGIAERHNLSVLVNEQLKSLKFVDVYVRNAKDRYISGVNTYSVNSLSESVAARMKFNAISSPNAVLVCHANRKMTKICRGVH